MRITLRKKYHVGLSVKAQTASQILPVRSGFLCTLQDKTCLYITWLYHESLYLQILEKDKVSGQKAEANVSLKHKSVSEDRTEEEPVNHE